MALLFNGVLLPGSHTGLEFSSPEWRGVRRTYPGLNGESEIFLGQGGFDIETILWLHNQYRTSLDFAKARAKVMAYIGTHGKLAEEPWQPEAYFSGSTLKLRRSRTPSGVP